MATLVAAGRMRAAKLCLAAAVIAYAVWAVLLDAATHGWGKGPVPF
jgi:hypothetical protein